MIACPTFTASLLVSLTLLLGACAGSATPSAPVAVVPAVTPVSVTTPPSEPAPELGLPLTGAQLYAGCQARVEGQSAAGECAVDADCSRAGCSQEVCVAAKNAGEVMTTCEIAPCFSALDACGCHDGLCSWTVKEPAMQLRKLPVPAPSSP